MLPKRKHAPRDRSFGFALSCRTTLNLSAPPALSLANVNSRTCRLFTVLDRDSHFYHRCTFLGALPAPSRTILTYRFHALTPDGPSSYPHTLIHVAACSAGPWLLSSTLPAAGCGARLTAYAPLPLPLPHKPLCIPLHFTPAAGVSRQVLGKRATNSQHHISWRGRAHLFYSGIQRAWRSVGHVPRLTTKRDYLAWAATLGAGTLHAHTTTTTHHATRI